VWAVALLAAAASLDVPYLPQTDRLCGGASLAMVLRYWGDTHASVQEFAPLVDPAADGIPAAALIAAVRRRGWTAVPEAGSVDTLRDAILRRRPTIVLLQDRPRRYHFVVVVGVDQGYVVIHDPARGPSRRIPIAEFSRTWAPTDNWSLLVLPPDSYGRGQPEAAVSSSETKPSTDRCERLVRETITEGGSSPLTTIEARLLSLRQQPCGSSPAPLRELAGVRFAQSRWREAAAFAEQAIALHDTDSYTWDLLASSRFVQNDLDGALRAWNAIGKPHVDLVHVEGLRRTRYPVLIDQLRLPTNTLLTADGFRAAQRRLAEWPGLDGTRIGFTPEADGYATVDVEVSERSAGPARSEWVSAGASAAVDREFRVEIPGPTGQAEVWSADWRWFPNRPAASVAFQAPGAGRLPGLWRVDGGWETESYGAAPFLTADATVRHSRVHGALSVSDWILPDLRYSVTLGLSSWDGTRRAASVGVGLDRRFFRDRLAIETEAARWIAIGSSLPFQSGRVRVSTQSSEQPARWRGLAEIGLAGVSENAPLTEWVGAGDGHAREALLRAHPLLQDGVITGSVFGRSLVHANGELQRWFDGRTPLRIGIAMFVDMAEAGQRLQPP
jgi:hypothetical protein